MITGNRNLVFDSYFRSSGDLVSNFARQMDCSLIDLFSLNEAESDICSAGIRN